MDSLNKFISKAKLIHGDKYDYSKVEYINNRTNVCIICPIHGEFWQKPCQHINMKRGCRQCGNEKQIEKKRIGNEEFIKRSREKHGDKYDYSKVEYVNNNTKVCIICPIHGEFWQIPKSHLKGEGCQKCAYEILKNSKTKTLEQFLLEAKSIHGDKYDYSKVEYKGCEEKTCFICPIHGEFWQTPSLHLNSNGCPLCSKKNAITKSHLINESKFMDMLHKLPINTAIDLSNVKYINSRTPIHIICKKHGDIFIYPLQFLKNNGVCPYCLKEKKLNSVNEKKLLKKEKKLQEKEKIFFNKINNFIKKAREKHGDKYDYSKVEYVNINTKVCIICPEHGEFWQKPLFHLKGYGCRKCSIINNKNKLTKTLEQFIEEANIIHNNKYDYSKVEYVNNHTKVCIICPKHGEFWQMPSMHINEQQGCPLCGTLSSQYEMEIVTFLQENIKENIEIRNHTLLKPKEIDIFIPSKNFAIEFNGLRWHSELFNNDKNYHLNKLEKCQEQNVNLLHIFEDEWLYHKDIVKSKILHLLNYNIYKEKIYARNCEIQLITTKDGNEFLEKNHIQGKCVSSIMLGAFYNNELIGVMSFLKNEKDKWILNRFATNINTLCIGIGGKLLSFFKKNYKYNEIITFADRRWTLNKDDNLYTKLGFTLIDILPPNYSYVSSKHSFKKRIHKFNCRKQILHKKYNLDLNLSELEMTKLLGLYRIWDCGLFKYVIQ